MSIIFLDITLFVIFTLFVIILLYKRKKKIEREGILYLYRTKIGIKIINYIGKKYEKALGVLKNFVIIFGYILMISIIFLIGQLLYFFIKFPEFVKAVKIPPIMPLVPYLPSLFKADFLPPFYFVYWIVIIAIVAIFHEFAHGIFAKKIGVKIKSTGFAFLGPFFGAFVEPDEEKMKRKSNFEQISVLSAGSFANLVLAAIFFVLFWIYFVNAFAPSGVIFNTYLFDVVNSSQITSIENNLNIDIDGDLNLSKVKIENETYFVETSNLNKVGEKIIAFKDLPAINAGLRGAIIKINNVRVENNEKLKAEILKYKPGEEIKITTLIDDSEKEFNIVLAENPANKSEPIMGVGILDLKSSSILGKIREKLSFFKNPNIYYAPKGNTDLTMFIYNFLWWILLINLSIALVNMLPVGIFDGGRVFYLTIFALTKSEKIAKKTFSIMTYLFLAVFIMLTVLWAVSLF